MKILIIGSNGRMGREMASLLKEKGISFLGIDVDNREMADGFACDVIVDFSSAACLHQNLMLAESKSCPIVIGTTGHDKNGEKLIKSTSEKVPVVLSSNFSLMFNVLLKLVWQLKSLADCDFVVEETHHKHKKDRPSGSCKMLLGELEELGVTPQVGCFRAGEVIGMHKLTIYGESETLSIEHRASNRRVFCEGALKACQFVLSKKSGLYTMSDVIDER